MSLSRVGGSSAAATSIAIPAHQAGDIILIWAFRDGSTTPPTVPTAGGTVPSFTTIDGPAGANTCAAVCAYAVAAGTTDTSGTWTNATGMSVEVWRGQSSDPIGGHAQSGGSVASGGNIAIPAITLTDPTGNSVILAFAGWRTVTAWNAAPAGYTQQSQVATECEALTKDSTTSDGTFNVSGTASGTGGTRTQQVELIADLGNRVTQEAVEVLYGTTAAVARVTQAAVEALVAIPTGGNRVTQVAVEVLVKSAGERDLDFISSVTTVYALALVPAIPVPFIASVTAVYDPALVGVLGVPFISSVTALYDPTLQDNVNVPFISSVTAVYDPDVVAPYIYPSFIASNTTVYALTLQGNLDVPFIGSNTTLYTPTLTAASSDVNVPFIASATAVYAPGLWGPIIAPSGVVNLTADAPTVYPIQLLFADQIGVIALQSDGANVSHITALTSGVITLAADPPQIGPNIAESGVVALKADPPAVAGSVKPPSGVIAVKADPPLPLGAVKPPAGVVKLSADPPTVIPIQAPSGSITLKGSPPANIYPQQAAGGRIILAGSSPPYMTPTSVPSGVLALKADSPTMAHATIILQQSGIIRLKSDVPIVIPLTEPPPNPPPLEGTGVKLSGTVG